MEIITNKIEHDLSVDYDLTIDGMVKGNVSVLKNGNLILYGMIMKNLIIESGGKCILKGMIIGDVHNKGGILEVYGMIKGTLYEENGSTKIDPNASVKK